LENEREPGIPQALRRQGRSQELHFEQVTGYNVKGGFQGCGDRQGSPVRRQELKGRGYEGLEFQVRGRQKGKVSRNI
jgi:hypothetical protein